MSWPLGYGMPSLRFRAALDGTIYAENVAVTESGGWIDLPVPDDVRTLEGPDEYSLRVRLSVDAAGKPFLHAEEVELGGRRFAGLYALSKTHGSTWLSAPGLQVKAAIESRLAAARSARLALETPATAPRARATTAPTLAPATLRPVADDTWGYRERDPRAIGE